MSWLECVEKARASLEEASQYRKTDERHWEAIGAAKFYLDRARSLANGGRGNV